MSRPTHRHILMTTDAVGGVWVYAMTLARALCDGGHSVTLVVMGPSPRADQMQSVLGVSGLDLEITNLALEWTDPEGSDVARARDKLLATAELVRPDIVHLNGYREAAFGWQQPNLVVAHSCVWSWWQACHGGEPDEARWCDYAAAAAAGLQAADAWVAPTAAFRDVVETIHRPHARGRVIWNGTDVRAEASVRAPSILAAGRLWDKAKNLSGLLAVAPTLGWPVRVAGPLRQDGSSGAEIFPGVEYLGALSRATLHREMHRASIFVSPGFYEPFGLSVLEAAACGCALVIADLPSLRELWDEAAIFVDPHDSEQLGHALRQLCRSPALRARLQTAALARAKIYSVDRMASAYCALYDEIAAPESSPRRTFAADLGAPA